MEVMTLPTDVVLPLELNWSGSGRTYRLRDRRERPRLYEVVLREGEPPDLERYLDGALLIDAWPDLVGRGSLAPPEREGELAPGTRHGRMCQ